MSVTQLTMSDEIEKRIPSGFYHQISAYRAKELLFVYGYTGGFLVRPSETSPYDQCISIHRGSRVTHVKLNCNGGGFTLPNGQQFKCLKDAVEFIKNTDNVLMEKGGYIIVKEPVEIPYYETVVRIGYDRFFHVGISGVEAEDLIANEPSGTFVVRESESNAGSFAITAKDNSGTKHIRIYHNEHYFGVVTRDHFETLKDLVEYYRTVPMVQYSGTPVLLKYPLLSTSFTAGSIDDRLDCLLSIQKRTGRDGISEEFAAVHSQEEKAKLILDARIARLEKNMLKNRYRNVVPFDYTRVVLKPIRNKSGELPGGDYINASYIGVAGTHKYRDIRALIGNIKYISTQGCMESTVSDFWHMIWQEDSRIIVMTTREKERNRIKCYVYWPAVNHEANYGHHDEFLVRNVSEEEEGEYIVRKFEVSLYDRREPGELIELETRIVWHFQYRGWIDNGCPTDAILNFREEIASTLEKEEKEKGKRGPMVVHCSAGIGRTGTFIVLDMVIEMITRYGPGCIIDLPKLVRMVREQRPTMVQTESQYRFIYYAISNYMREWRASRCPDAQQYSANKWWHKKLIPTIPSEAESVDPDDELMANDIGSNEPIPQETPSSKTADEASA